MPVRIAALPLEHDAELLALDQLGSNVELLDRADFCHTVSFSLSPMTDFGYLQAAWAIARWMVDRGGSVVLDVHAARFSPTDAVRAIPPDAPLDVPRELSFIFETDADGDGNHVVHTRGMRKFGRPDLVAQVGPDDANLVRDIFVQLAIAMADGPVPGSPRHGVDLTERITLYLVPDDVNGTAGGASRPPPRMAERLGLNNDALLLVSEEGGTLRGLAARLG
jgi:hypothetical protein